jgi:hypothetical protein
MELESKAYEFEAALLRALETLDAAERWARGEQIFTGCLDFIHSCGIAKGLG